MNIVVNGADYSGSGLGKVPFVTPEVETILSIYPGLSQSKKLAFQLFIDTIGGLTGALWATKIKYLFLPVLASNLLEAMKDVKGNATPFANLPDADKPTYYSFASGRLTQLDVALGSKSNLLVMTAPWYAASIFGSVKRDASTAIQNNLANYAYGNILKTGNTNHFQAQKYDNVSENQTANIFGSSTKAAHSYAVSGLTGIDSTNQNVIYVDGNSQLFNLKPLANLAGTPSLGRLGFAPNSSSPGVTLRDVYMQGYGSGFTREETQLVEGAISAFMTGAGV